MTRLQPYQKFVSSFITRLIQQDKPYVVSQSYSRADEEADHTKTPVLFSPYKELYEARSHFIMLNDHFAALADIRLPKTRQRLEQICSGRTDIIPYLAAVQDIQAVNRFIDQHYYNQMRSWVRRNREKWNIREANSLQPFFETEMGVPMVKIKWGSHHVMVKLEELENL